MLATGKDCARAPKPTGIRRTESNVAHRSAHGRATAVLSVALLVTGCASVPEPLPPPVVPAPTVSSRIVTLAEQEWRYFGQQTIRYDAGGESIAPVGFWEDEDPQSARVQNYWAAVGKPEWTGKDCEVPWSAAFIGWVMQQAGVPANQFLPAIAHWMYLADFLAHQGEAGRYFAARTLESYAPRPGDLICATRADTQIAVTDILPTTDSLRYAKLHCNVVVDCRDGELLAIGGNFRNSVSQVAIALDDHGHIKSAARHAWFLIVENRMR